MDESGVFVMMCCYPDEEAAEVDQKVVKALHSSDTVGRFETTVITKDQQGRVHVAKGESNVHGWARRGLVVGAIVGVMFPPSILLTAGAGAALGGFGAKDNGLVLKAIPPADLDALGQLICAGEAALVIVGEESAHHAIALAHLKPTRQNVRTGSRHLRPTRGRDPECSRGAGS